MPESALERIPLRIAVDLTPLLAGGGNGGVKPFIFEYITWLGQQNLRPLQFVFLTREASHAEVRTLARFGDELVCVLQDDVHTEILTPGHSPKERAFFPAPDDLIVHLGVDLLYAPFGHCRWHWPGIPTIATAVDGLHRDFPQSLGPADIAFRECLFSEMRDKADMIQCISLFTMDRMATCYDVPKERMFCSYIAIHERLKRITPGNRTSDNGPYFLFPANAWKHKNHPVLLLAYGIYRQKMGVEAWDLVLTGHDDASMRDVLGLADTLGLGDHVRYLGHLKEDEYTSIWAHAGALLFPSLYEGFGIPLIEAMAFGLPIIASKSGSIEEIGGDACLYVDPRKPDELAESMGRLTRDAHLRKDLSERARVRLESFSFPADASHFLERIMTCAATPARVTVRGLYPDLWTMPIVAFGSPAWNARALIEITVCPMPEARTFDLRCDGNVIAHHVVPAAVRHKLSIPVHADGRRFSLEVANPTSLSPTDHRVHGLLLESLCFLGPEGRQINLLSLQG